MILTPLKGQGARLTELTKENDNLPHICVLKFGFPVFML